MKISIVTVTFNSARTIGDALKSVASQDYPDIEHIVIDGGSSDDTLSAVRAQGSHVSKIVSEPDNGIFDAMNKGLACATGEFVGFLNGDDMLCSRKAIEKIAAAASEPSVGAVYGDLVYVKQNDPSSIVRRWHAGTFHASRLKFGWMPPHPTFYIRRSLVDRIGNFDPQFHIAADYDFMLRYLRSNSPNVRYIPEILTLMRTGGASNRSFGALLRKSSEDLAIMQKNGVGGLVTLVCKNLRKIPQFLPRNASS